MKATLDPQLAAMISKVTLPPEKIRSFFTRDALFIDTRPVSSYLQLRIPGAISVPADEIATRYREIPFERLVVLYGSGDEEDLSPCIAGVFRTHLGFERIYALDGGLKAWQAQQLPVESEPLTLPPTTSLPEPLPWMEIDVLEAYCRQRQGHVLVDIREPEEFERGHPAGVLHIPMGEIFERMDELADMTPLLLICNSGNRSGMLAEWLIEEGFHPHDVTNVIGGVIAWQIHQLPWETGAS